MFQGMTQMVKSLFYTNVIVFIITLFCQLLRIPFVEQFACYNFGYPEFHVYQLITSMFIHGGVFHILCNMLALVSLGPSVESYLGSRKFLLYYLICGICGSLLFMASTTSNIPSVGASGAIYGIALMFAVISPNEKLYFFFIPIGFRAKYLMTFLFLLEVYLGFNGVKGDNVAHFAHVGGGLAGLALLGLNNYLPKSFDKYI